MVRVGHAQMTVVADQTLWTAEADIHRNSVESVSINLEAKKSVASSSYDTVWPHRNVTSSSERKPYPADLY